MSANALSTVAPRRDLSNLDLMRAIAVLMVVAAHLLEMSSAESGSESIYPFAWHLGRMGVLIFFVHTSLVLMFSLERTQHDRSGHRLFGHFYFRRVFRIYPLAMVTVALCLLLGSPRDAWRIESLDFTLPEIAANFLLVQNLMYARLVLHPLWSLPLELQMYVVLPFLFLLLERGRRANRRMAVATALFGGALAVGAAQVWFALSGRLDVLLFAPCFVAGLVAYARLPETRPSLPAGLWPVLIGGLSIAYTAVAARTGEAHPAWVSWAYCGAIGVALPHFRDLAPGLLQRGAAQIAKYSYGIYLFHMFGIWLAWGPTSPLDLSPALAFVVFLSGLILAPIASYHWIEAPLIRLGGRWAGRLT